MILATVASPRSAAADATVVETEAAAHERASYRYAQMTAEQAYAELDRRGVPYVKVDRKMNGVLAPVRLSGNLHGVHIHSSLPEEQRATSAFEILDARLALSLDDFAVLLERHGVVEVVHFTMYRPNGLKPGSEHDHGDEPKSDDKPVAKKKRQPDSKKRATKKRATKKRATPKKKRATPKKKRATPKKKALGKGSKSDKHSASRSAPKSSSKQKTDPKKKKKAAPSKSSKRAKKPAATKKHAATKKRSSKKRSADSKRSSNKRAATKNETEDKPVAYSPPGTRHPAGLAIDVGGFRKSDGRWLGVAQHFRGKIGRTTCGNGATPANVTESRELWSIACESVELGIFTYVLTPNYDAAHADHFHMEIRPGVTWHMVK